MFNPTDLPDLIPIFPLKGALLLPRGRLPLHIFEPRYLTMVNDALKTDSRLIGMIQPSKNGLQRLGCAGRITGFSETDDGRYMISLTGVCRFRINDEIEMGQPYRRFNVQWRDFLLDLTATPNDSEFDRPTFLALLKRFFDLRGLSGDWDDLSAIEDELLINSLSMLCPFSEADKQGLLESPTLRDRRHTLTTLIEFAFHQGGKEKLQ